MAISDQHNFKKFAGFSRPRIKEKIDNFRQQAAKFLIPKKIAVLSAVFILFLTLPFHNASADPITDALSGFAQTILFATPYYMFLLFSWVAAGFVYIAVFLVNAAIAPAIYAAIINSAAIDRGWTIMRDTANMFFILILIFIALATTLRLQSYSARNWLPKLLFAALFINYSKVITMFVIDIGNMFMYGVISWMGGGLEYTGLNEMFNAAVKIAGQNTITLNVTFTKLVSAFAALMFNVVLALTLLATGVLFLIRIAMLTVLTIFSPFAFMLSGWPGAGKYSSGWWSSLIKYVIFGPIMVFFLFIAGEMAASLFAMGPFAPVPTNSVGEIELGGLSYMFGILIPYTIVIVMLITGLKLTAEMGVMGAGMVMGQVQGLAKGIGFGVGFMAAKPIFSKLRRGAGWVGGAGKAIKEGRLKQYGKDTIKGMPKQFAGGVWDATGGNVLRVGGELKDQYEMTRNKWQEAERKKAEERAAKLNLKEPDLKKRIEGAKSAEEEAGYVEYARKKGYSLVDRDKEKEKQKELNEAKERGDAPEKLDEIKQILKQIKEQNDNKEKKIVEVAIRGGIDKSELANSRPDLAPIINGKTIKEQINKMIDDGASFNRVNKDSFRNADFINSMRDDVYKNDPERFKTFMDSLGTEKRNTAKETMNGMVEKLKDETTGKINMETSNPEGLKNFHTASTLAILQEKNLDKVFEGATDFKEAMEDFTKHYWRDLTKFDQRADQLLIAQHIGPDTLQQFGKRDLNPAERRNFVKLLIDVHTGKNGAVKTDKKDALETIRDREVWKSCLKKDADEDYIKIWNAKTKKDKKETIKKKTLAEKLEEEEEEEENTL